MGASYFSKDYEEALSRFLRAGERRGAERLTVSLSGELTHEYLWFGDRAPRSVVFHMAGTHGIEGFVGSAIQLAILDQLGERISKYCSSGARAVVFLAALNPWGFKNLRRVNENNVDLNRNFLVPWNPPAACAEYVKLNDWLNPRRSSNSLLYYLQAVRLVLKYGIPTLKQALAGGQGTYPRGIYFCGDKLQAESVKFIEFFSQNFSKVDRLNAIEIHSGLGDFAQNTVFSFQSDAAERARLSKLLGVSLIDDDPADVGIRTSGDIGRWFQTEFTKPGFNWFLQEFGTYHPIRVLKALRDENAEFHRSGGSADAQIQLLNAFCPVGPWRDSVVRDGVRLFERTIEIALS